MRINYAHKPCALRVVFRIVLQILVGEVGNRGKLFAISVRGYAVHLFEQSVKIIDAVKPAIQSNVNDRFVRVDKKVGGEVQALLIDEIRNGGVKVLFHTFDEVGFASGV